MKVAFVVACALALASHAAAATTNPALNAVLSEYAQRPATAVCHTPEEWAALGAERGFDPNQLLGFVTTWSFDGGQTWTPEPVSHQAPGVCERVEAFRLSPTRETQKMCQDGFDQVPRVDYRLEERVRYESRVKYVPSQRWVHVLRDGKRAKVLRPYRKRVTYRVRVIYTVQVPVTVYDEVPHIVVCTDWPAKTQALHVVVHEATHIAGGLDEQETDCYAMRNLDWFAWRLGATPEFAREIQADEWTSYMRHSYFLPSCVQD